MPSVWKITHVVYDLDGLLLNTESIYTRASQSIAQRFGKVFDWSLKSRMIGKWAIDSAKIFTEALELPLSPEAYLEERRILLEAMFPDAEPMPGAVRLTRHLHRHRIPQAVATSSDRRHFELKISRHTQWFSIFDCFVIGDEPQVKRGKPAPDIFLLAASRLKAAPSRCLAFEDSPAGLQAALAAGMSVIVVPDPHMTPAAFPGAHQVLRNLNQFDPAAWGLPPYSPIESADAGAQQKE
jgi:pseudouridine-5'-monophosphatase